MNHIDNHTLELYVLGAQSVEPKRGEIEAHLRACEHCRTYAEKVGTFYSNLDENLQNELPEPSSRALTRRHADDIAPVFYNDAPPVPYRPTTRMEKFRYFTRRHPIVTGSGAFVMLAGLAVLASNVVTTAKKDTNPAYHRYNAKEGLVEIRNAGGELLWNIPGDEIESAEKQDRERHVFTTIVADIDGDGTNEVLTTKSRSDERENRKNPLRVFDKNKKILFTHQFSKPIYYLNREYPETWFADAILVAGGNTPRQKETLVLWSCSRSPTVITRLDARGHALGEYWHFGQVTSIYMVDLEDDGKQELVVAGINDTKDSVSGEFPFIAVLDPQGITAAGRSSASEGFRLPVSNAELYYIGLQKSRLASVVHGNEIVNNMERDLPDALTFKVGGLFPEGTTAWEYVFNRDMSLRTVKSSSVSSALFRRLLDIGKLRTISEQATLNELKEGVRYWDGKEWRKEVTRVQSNPEVAAK